MKKKILALSAILLAVLAFAAQTVSVKTADYAVTLADDGAIIVVNSGSARIVYLPSLPTDKVGFSLTVQKRGAGNVTTQAQAADYIADSGVGQYVRNTTAAETYASITLIYAQANRWQILAASGTWSTDTSTMTFGANIAASLAAKAPLASPTFTGTVTLPVGLTGYVKATAGVASAGAIADGDLPATIKGSTITTIGEADFDIDEVKSTGIVGYGLVVVTETSGKVVGLFRLDGNAIVSVSANALYSVSKDTGSKINVYWETDQVKVQNKISTGVIEAVSVVAAGANYLVNDVLTLADGAAGTVTVATISGDAHVDTISLTAPGLGYSTGIAATTAAPAGGTGCTIDVTAVDGVDGHVDTAAISAPGLGYAINDVLTIAGGVGGDATVTVTAIDKGHVTGVTLTVPGTGYTVATHATAGGTGTGCTIGVTAIVGLVLKIVFFGIV